MRSAKVTTPKRPDAVDGDIVVPDGTPAWITPELIRLTLKIWQPYYSERLTPEEAVTMVQSAGRLLGLLSRE